MHNIMTSATFWTEIQECTEKKKVRTKHPMTLVLNKIVELLN